MGARDGEERLVYMFGFPLELRPPRGGYDDDAAEPEYEFDLSFRIARLPELADLDGVPPFVVCEVASAATLPVTVLSDVLRQLVDEVAEAETEWLEIDAAVRRHHEDPTAPWLGIPAGGCEPHPERDQNGAGGALERPPDLPPP